MKTSVGDDGRLRSKTVSTKHSKRIKKQMKHGKGHYWANIPGKILSRLPLKYPHFFSIKNNINTVPKAMADFPLKDDLVPSFANKKDYKEIAEHRISMADVWNGDGFLYKTIAQLLHVHRHLHHGIPGNYKTDVLPLHKETRTRDDGTEYEWVEDKNFELRCQMYSDDLKSLRDEFIWLYEAEFAEYLNDVCNRDYDKAFKDIENRRKEAFKKLAELAPSLWT